MPIMKHQGLSRNVLFVCLAILVFLAGSVTGAVLWRPYCSADGLKLIDASIETLAEGLNSEKFTSVDLVRAYIARIAEVNGVLHAVNEINPDAISIASQLDAERSRGSVRGPLHGIPIMLKDNIATMDLMNNTAGSFALLGAKVPEDSTIARKLRAAGAILLGKTNLSEWANFRSLNSSNGWSAYGNQSHGSYYPNEDPWGSSSGSAISAALGLSAVCLGTETDGSITSPCSFNNLVGIKPTVGLTSRYLVIPVSQHQDTVGPLARTVKDATYVLQAIAGADPHDNYTSAIPNGTVPNYLDACKLSGLSGVRLGVARNAISVYNDSTSPAIMTAFEQALEVLREAGATIIDDTNFTAAAEYRASNLQNVILEADFLVDLYNYLELLSYNPHKITSVADLRAFTQTFPPEDYHVRDTGIWDHALQNWNNTDPHFWPTYQQYLYFAGDGGILGALSQYDLDGIVLPAKFATDWAAPAGTPIVTVPMGAYPNGTAIRKDSWGLVEAAPNIPFGISFLGAKFTESKLIGMAYAYEQRTMFRKKTQPYITPKMEICDISAGY